MKGQKPKAKTPCPEEVNDAMTASTNLMLNCELKLKSRRPKFSRNANLRIFEALGSPMAFSAISQFGICKPSGWPCQVSAVFSGHAWKCLRSLEVFFGNRGGILRADRGYLERVLGSLGSTGGGLGAILGTHGGILGGSAGILGGS